VSIECRFSIIILWNVTLGAIQLAHPFMHYTYIEVACSTLMHIGRCMISAPKPKNQFA